MSEEAQFFPRELTADELARVRVLLHTKADTFAARVAPLYASLGWEWARGEHYAIRYVPSRVEIAAALHRLIGEMGPRGRIDSGGLSVWADASDCSGVECGLQFSLNDSWDVDV